MTQSHDERGQRRGDGTTASRIIRPRGVKRCARATCVARRAIAGTGRARGGSSPSSPRTSHTIGHAKDPHSVLQPYRRHHRARRCRRRRSKFGAFRRGGRPANRRPRAGERDRTIPEWAAAARSSRPGIRHSADVNALADYDALILGPRRGTASWRRS